MAIQTIKNRYNGDVIFETDALDMRAAVALAAQQGVSLRAADLQGVQLRHLNLRGAMLAWANLDGADLTGSAMNGATLSGCSMRNVTARSVGFDGATLNGAKMNDADLRDALLRGADMVNTVFTGADITYAMLHCASIDQTHLAGTKLTPTNAERATLIGERPVLCLGPLGSRGDYLTAYVTDRGVYIMTGCFCGTLQAFEIAVKCNHMGTVHASEYKMAADLIRLHRIEWAM